jgi:hypothetical protein
MMIQRNTEADQGPCTLVKTVVDEGLIREDQRVKVCEIADVTGTAESGVHEIISDLNFRKVTVRRVLKMLIEEQKSTRMAALLHPQISTSLGHLRTFYQENVLRTKTHCKNQLCNTSYTLERITTVKECLNL